MDKNKNNVALLGIGIFLWIFSINLTYLFELALREVLLICSVNALIIFWTSESFRLLFCILTVIIGINILSKTNKSYRKAFALLMILFIVVSVLQILLPIILQYLRNDKYVESQIQYWLIKDEHLVLNFISSTLDMVTPFIIAIIILIKTRKTVANKS